MSTSFAAILLATTLSVACKSGPETGPAAALSTPLRDGRATVLGRVRLPLSEQGLSGLTRDQRGILWTTPERGRLLVPLSQSGIRFERAGEPVPLVGFGKGWDAESIAWVAPDTFALGSESQEHKRPIDYVAIARVADGVARVVETIGMSYAPWGIKARVNRGIEGLCHVDGVLVAGDENVIETKSGRWAPVARYDLAAKTWTTFRLRLVSETGKLSSVACRLSAEGERIELLAVERHFGIAHLLRFSMPREGEGSDLVAIQVADLGKLVAGVPNMEGLDWQADGTVVVIVDNNTGGVTGPNEAIVLELAD